MSVAAEKSAIEWPSEAGEERVLRVSEINRLVRASLETQWGAVWVEGELSDVTRAVSGHCYFTLNDEQDAAQLRAVMFRADARRLRFELVNGLRVRLRGMLSLYEARGSFQMLARVAMLAGEGDAAARFARLRHQLAAEGLFDSARKRSLPRLPATVGVVTSRSGAALHDICEVLSQRCPVRLVVADCRVQGEQAPASIVSALMALQRRADIEVVLIARGGGAAEDLWAFNDEQVVRAIAAFPVPTISGVGHEVDITLADLAADQRAATPSHAAEMVVPARATLQAELAALQQRLHHAVGNTVQRCQVRLQRLQQRQRDPRRRLWVGRQRLDALTADLLRHLRRQLAARRTRLHQLDTLLLRHDARSGLARDRARLLALRQGLLRHAKLATSQRRSLLLAQVARLDALSPLKVLARGYAIVLHAESGQAVTRAEQAQAGDRLHLRLAQGALQARVEAVGDGQAAE